MVLFQGDVKCTATPKTLHNRPQPTAPLDRGVLRAKRPTAAGICGLWTGCQLTADGNYFGAADARGSTWGKVFITHVPLTNDVVGWGFWHDAMV